MTQIPLGLCQCGCGERTPLAKTSRHGNVKGLPRRFVNPGHAARKPANEHFRKEDRGYTTPCWVWQLSKNSDGYGNLWVDGSCKKAHRVYYEDHVGPIPDGLQIDHLCRVRICVNPEHLEPVTSRENSLRGITIAARNVSRAHCPNGHEYTPENTKVRNGHWRSCRECHREQGRLAYAAKQVAA